jgi:leader peptidase (prepilin peptidase)/N-methyltransferase
MSSPLSAAPVWAWAGGGAVLGAIVGSYLATIVLRWPAGEAARGRSRCDGCGVKLRPIDLVPILSWALLRGRCARCGVRIDPRHPAIEVCAALIGGVSLAVAPGAGGLIGAVCGWLLLALAALDLAHLWLPDRLTGALALVALAGGIAGFDPSLADRMAGGVFGFASLWAIAAAYRRVRGREGMGAGDPKLFGAIGLWLGLWPLPFVLLAACAVGFAWVGLQMMRRRAATMVPFGAMLAIAAWPVWLLAIARG